MGLINGTLFELCNKQVELMRHLHHRGFCSPNPVVAANGHYIWRLNMVEAGLINEMIADLSPPENGFFMVTLLEFIPGRILSSLHPVPYYLFYEAGQMLARLHELAKTYEGDSQPLKELSNNSYWSLEQAGEVSNYMEVVTDEELSSIILQVVIRFKENVLPRLSDLPSGIIHGDYNDDNIIISSSSEQCITPSSSELNDEVNVIDSEPSVRFSITGVIDFSDMSHSYLVFDIAKALSFMVITDVPDIMVAVKHFMNGYSSSRELLQVEKDVLISCTMASLAQNIVLALKDYSINPGNSYLLASMDDYPVALKKLFQHTDDELMTMWNLCQ
ncbi:hydroxylysine kinase-like isoform X2 [Apostichopus japonicus]|uniref:hydroxylysine kinase-like isoform X2 n=1 Tax=Stichopus japonicus TaxID=307972 RepID=UPI003AB1313F